ncbi:hypothetical protein [Streptomyces sp. KN37]|uniref:hypothetical protein n=1 Tax=Streptomyces sp. KN37 TaxID=3090667 RepID=UPI002A748BAC|nr:hypothetical protein [Streptomyces sp. KN37]WPO76242.1 hypothetical protein R9806_36815 [Streptomyces sp. KN37]
MDWNPSNASESALIDSGKSASLDSDSYYSTGGHGVLYEITAAGVLKSYQDRSASGGSLLTPVKTYTSNWTARHNRV